MARRDSITVDTNRYCHTQTDSFKHVAFGLNKQSEALTSLCFKNSLTV